MKNSNNVEKPEASFFDALRDFVYNHDEWAKIKIQQIVQTSISVSEVLDRKDLYIVKDALDFLKEYSDSRCYPAVPAEPRITTLKL